MDLGEQLKTFSKDSIRLVKRCTKPDAKGRSNGGRLPSVEREREKERERDRIDHRRPFLIDAGESMVDFATCSSFSSFGVFNASAELKVQGSRCSKDVELCSIYEMRSGSTMERLTAVSGEEAIRL